MRLKGLIIFLAGLAALAGVGYANDKQEFVTWEGIGPDKWVSTWLIRRHIAPDATIRFIKVGEKPESGMAYDIPTIPPYVRNGKSITFENLIKGYHLNDPVLDQISLIIRDIEINYWSASESVAKPFVENAYRGLQEKFGRESVPQSCYFQLFDALYEQLKKAGKSENIKIAELEKALSVDKNCGSVKNITVESDKKFVSEWHPMQILGFLGAGDKVVFIDTRETDEFDEGHIPNAINIKLRDIDGDKDLPVAVKEADVVIPYCVKDFRGFEVAKRLKKLGVKKVGLMNPWGIAGWKKEGLPVAGSRGLKPNDAVEKLQSCVNHPTTCIKDA